MRAEWENELYVPKFKDDISRYLWWISECAESIRVRELQIARLQEEIEAEQQMIRVYRRGIRDARKILREAKKELALENNNC